MGVIFIIAMPMACGKEISLTLPARQSPFSCGEGRGEFKNIVFFRQYISKKANFNDFNEQ
jgi:hypothetical protein